MPSTTSLLRSAASTREKIRNYEDRVAAFEWQSSAQTADDYARYARYLTDRLRGTDSGGEALSYQTSLRSANRSFVSNEIQRVSQQIQEGSSSLYDKQAAIQQLYQQAVNNEDLSLAQNIVSQWNSLSVQIQNQERIAQQDSIRLYEAQESDFKKQNAAKSKDFVDIADSLEGSLADLSREFGRSGQLGYNKAAKEFMKQNRETLKALGIDLPENIIPSVGQLTQDVVEAIGEYYVMAGNVSAPTNPDAAASYYEKAKDIATGQKQFSTAGGRLTYEEVRQLATRPDAYVESTDDDGNTVLKKSTVAGYRIDENGQLVTAYTGATKEGVDGKLKSDAEKRLKELGFGNISYDEGRGVYKVQIGSDVLKWLDPELVGKSQNAEIELEPTATGFQYLDRGSNRLFNIAVDNRGLAGLYRVDPVKGAVHLTGQYGFNQQENTLQQNLPSIVSKRRWAAPMITPAQQILAKTPQASKVPAINAAAGGFPSTPDVAAAQGVLGVINRASSGAGAGSPSMTQRAGGGFNFTDSKGNPISAYTYAQQTGSDFRTVLNTAASKGDTFAASALKYAGNDGAYNPSTVPGSVAKNWQSLTWGNNIKLQTPQSTRVPGSSAVPIFRQLGM